MTELKHFTAFSEAKKVAAGSLKDVALRVKKFLQESGTSNVLIFDDSNSRPVEIDFRGTSDAVIRRIEASEPQDVEKKTGPGRPKLGVIAREVTLLPHHWDWLSGQSGGASVTLRKLVEDAKKKNSAKDQIRLAQESTYRFMNAMAGDFENFEEALRSLYAKDEEKFAKWMKGWPKDIRDHVLKLSENAFP